MSKFSKAKSHKNKCHSKDSQKLTFTRKKYDYDLSSIDEPPKNQLIDKAVWNEGAQNLTGAMVMMVVGPSNLLDELVSVSAEIMRGLPKDLTVQSIKAAEDILNSGCSGHFVTLPGYENEIVRFDTSVEAAYFMAKTPGAFASSQEDIELHLVAKAEQLEFLL